MAYDTLNCNEWNRAGVAPRDMQRAEEALSCIIWLASHPVSYPYFQNAKIYSGKVMIVCLLLPERPSQ